MARRRAGPGRDCWALITPTHVVGVTISSLDYASLTQVWVLDRASGAQVDEVAVVAWDARTFQARRPREGR